MRPSRPSPLRALCVYMARYASGFGFNPYRRATRTPALGITPTPGTPYAATLGTDLPAPRRVREPSTGTMSRIPGRSHMTCGRVLFGMVAGAVLLTAGCRDVDVTAVDAARIEITPSDTSVHVEEVTRLIARVLSSRGDVLSGRTILWTSMHPELADVSATGDVVGIAPGTATIRASSEGASATADVTVTPAPAILLAPASVTFASVQKGANPPDHTVAVTNSGAGELTGLVATVGYATGQATGWLTATFGVTTAPATITLAAVTGDLVTGVYDATVQISSSVAHNSPQTLDVRFDVGVEPAAIAVSPEQLEFSALRGGGNPPAQNVAIANSGAAPLTGLTIAVNYPGGQPAGFVSTTLSSTTAPATLAVRVTTGTLATGTYAATVSISSSVAANSPQIVDVAFDVGEPPPAIAVAPANAAFATTRVGSNPPPQQVAITNGGGGTLSGLSQTIVYTSGQPTGWLTAALSGTTAPGTLTLTAAKGILDIGSYAATVRVASSAANNSPLDVDVVFTIAESPPAAASALTAATVSQQRIDLAWTDNSANESRFSVERSHGSGDWTEIGSTVANGTSFVDSSGLAPSTVYFHRVRACNVAGCSAVVGPTSATTAPAPPSGIGAVVISATRIDLAWTDNSTDESAFHVERSTAGGAWTLIHTSTPDATSFSDVTATPETSYDYRVRACRADECSTPGNIAGATTGVAPPGAPSALQAAAISTSQVNLSWVAGTGVVDEYHIERRVGATGAFVVRDTVAAATLGYDDTGLASATQYSYRVEACNDGGCSGYSNTALATTQPDPPGAPSGLQAGPVDGTPNAIDIAWTASTGVVEEYRIERRTGAAGEFEPVDTVADGTLAYHDAGLTAATQYTYRVEACNGTGCSSAFSNEASTTTNPNPPAAPTNLNVSAVDSMSSVLDVQWTASTGVVVEYEIERRTATGAFGQVATVPAGTETHEDDGLLASTQYFYRARACNAGGCSAYGSEAQAFTNPAAPDTPPILAAAAVTGSSTAINLTWSDVDRAVEYRIERRTGTAAFVRIDIVTASSYQDIELTPNTLYSYRVAACNAGGCSAFTDVEQAMTNP